MVHHGTVPSAMVKAWQATAGEQIMCQIEMYAALLVRFRYRDLLLNRPCIFFIDNEAARIALLKGVSPSISLFRMTHAVSVLDAAKPCGIWYERVPSFSNISDLPSRGKAWLEESARVTLDLMLRLYLFEKPRCCFPNILVGGLMITGEMLQALMVD